MKRDALASRQAPLSHRAQARVKGEEAEPSLEAREHDGIWPLASGTDARKGRDARLARLGALARGPGRLSGDAQTRSFSRDSMEDWRDPRIAT